MNQNFLVNRYNFSNLIEYIKATKELPMDIIDSETGIEFYGVNTISKEELIYMIENFNIFDNLAQNDAMQEYECQNQFEVKNYQFEPSWAELDHNKIVIGYVGSYVNTDFDLTFSKVDDQWILMK